MDPLDPGKVRELLDLTGGDRTWLRDLLKTYVDDTSRRLAELSTVVEAGHTDRIQRDAHGIKGSSSNIGAVRMARLCHEMETFARASDLVGARHHLIAMRDEFDRIRDWILRFGDR